MKGVEKGIEKSSKIMMPTLFIIIVILVVCSVTLPGAGAGIEFLLKPDFSKVDGNVFLSCYGPSLLLFKPGNGMSLYVRLLFQKETNLTKTAFSVGTLILSSYMPGFIIFPGLLSP